MLIKTRWSCTDVDLLPLQSVLLSVQPLAKVHAL